MFKNKPTSKAIGDVRRSQLITTYGVGAIVALGDASVMIAGTDRWQNVEANLHEPRLEARLRVDGFVVPPSRGHDVPAVRFPAWGYCPVCRRLGPFSWFSGIVGHGKCPTCDKTLVPSRFVVVCLRGHIDDFPYIRWLHRDPTLDSGAPGHEMTIEAAGASAALRDIVLRCSCGVPDRTMQGAFARDAFKGIATCSGNRPWLGDREGGCVETPRTLQRGASNVYFPVPRSAISIPPWSEGIYQIINQHWILLRYVPDEALAPTLEGLLKSKKSAFTTAELVDAVRRRKNSTEAEAEEDTDTDEQALRSQEFQALVHGKPEDSREQQFVCLPVARHAESAAWFDAVMEVKKLREVRVLKEFTRLQSPTGNPAVKSAPLSSTRMNWLPGIEVKGEGVFLRLAADTLASWEHRPGVVARTARINENYVRKFAQVGMSPPREITPRLVLIHTLAHVLINEWSLSAGYPAASLCERLYVSDDMAGLLIYTATTDAAGSLGGVVAQAAPDRLRSSVRDAVARASWCSSDPLCIEAVAAGTDSLNLAACHACVLLPEVSCEHGNVVLDRALLVGTPAEADLGFFGSLIEES